MRYTTLIDISELTAVYRSQSARLLYLHMALKAGYHDDDRDICLLSIRRAAADIGLTISATRHALRTLERAALIERVGSAWRVQKFIIEKSITPRARSQKKQREIDIREYEQQQQAEREAREQAERRRLREEHQRTGKTSLERMIEGLERAAANGDVEAAERLKYWKKIKK